MSEPTSSETGATLVEKLPEPFSRDWYGYYTKERCSLVGVVLLEDEEALKGLRNKYIVKRVSIYPKDGS